VVIWSEFSSALVFDHLPNLLSSLDFPAPKHVREKRLVTFQMAPKKSKRQMFEKEATMADGWKKSKLSKAGISSLVSRRLLQSRALVQWQPAEGHGMPFEKILKLLFSKPLLSMALPFPFATFCGVFFSSGGFNFII
jgi:hypothetical protein